MEEAFPIFGRSLSDLQRTCAANACRKSIPNIGLYHTQRNWWNPWKFRRGMTCQCGLYMQNGILHLPLAAGHMTLCIIVFILFVIHMTLCVIVFILFGVLDLGIQRSFHLSQIRTNTINVLVKYGLILRKQAVSKQPTIPARTLHKLLHNKYEFSTQYHHIPLKTWQLSKLCVTTPQGTHDFCLGIS